MEAVKSTRWNIWLKKITKKQESLKPLPSLTPSWCPAGLKVKVCICTSKTKVNRDNPLLWTHTHQECACVQGRVDTLFLLFRFTASGESSLYSRHREMSAPSDRPARSSRTDICGTSWALCSSSSSSPQPSPPGEELCTSTYARQLPIRKVWRWWWWWGVGERWSLGQTGVRAWANCMMDLLPAVATNKLAQLWWSHRNSYEMRFKCKYQCSQSTSSAFPSDTAGRRAMNVIIGHQTGNLAEFWYFRVAPKATAANVSDRTSLTWDSGIRSKSLYCFQFVFK